MSGARVPVTVDIVLFAIRSGELFFLSMRRSRQPARGQWALPEGFLTDRESLDEAAHRVLREETGEANAYLEQLYTFGDPARDSRGHRVSVAYLGVAASMRGSADQEWRGVHRAPRLAFDHDRILARALERLRTKTEYSTLPLRFLPENFTLSEVQQVYETLLERTLDKRNFRRKMRALDALHETGGSKREGAHRPARLFRLSPGSPYLLKERGILFPF